jgi:hypothetical protein
MSRRNSPRPQVLDETIWEDYWSPVAAYQMQSDDVWMGEDDDEWIELADEIDFDDADEIDVDDDIDKDLAKDLDVEARRTRPTRS